MNLGRLLSNAADYCPDMPALIWGDQRATYSEVNARTDALAGSLISLGIRKGDRIGVLMRNCPELIETFFAAWKAGACVVPLNARFVSSEIEYHLNDSEAAAIIFGPEFRDTISAIRQNLPALKHCICTGEPTAAQIGFDELISAQAGLGPEAPFAVDVEDDDLAWLFYTSGTTGRPKGAMLTHGNLTFMAVGWVADLTPVQPDDVALHAAPLTHGAGFHSIAMTLRGASQVIAMEPHFSPERFCALVQQHRVTNTWLVPTQIKMLLRYPDLCKWDLSSLKWIVYGGAPMYVEDLKEGLAKLGKIFVQLYGQGETPMTATYLKAGDHSADGPEAARLASCGIARSGVDVRILSEEGDELPRGEVGEICVKGPSVMKGYWRREDATAAALRDGWLRTGDLASMDHDGFVYILDRNKDMIITGGSNVYPREIEEILLQHPAVHEVCVIGVPDELWGESVKAVVVRAPGVDITADEIITFATARMAGYKKPRSVDFVSELPKNAYGKVLKRELRDAYIRRRN